MSTEAEATICFGVVLEPGEAKPWREAYDLEWWRSINGFEPPFELFTPEGEFVGGESPPFERVMTYYYAARAWDDEHPMPFDVVETGSDDDDGCIVAVPGTVMQASWEEPLLFEPNELMVDQDKVARFTDFLRQHGINKSPKWLLSAYLSW